MEQFEMAMYVRTAVSKLHRILLFHHRITCAIIYSHRSNIKPERATANQHNFQMHTFEKNTNCRACKMLLRWGLSHTTAILAELQRRRSELRRASTHVTRLLVWPLLHELLHWLAVFTRVKSYCTDLNLPPCSADQCAQWILIISAPCFNLCANWPEFCLGVECSHLVVPTYGVTLGDC